VITKTTIGDLLGAAARERLAALARPDRMRNLAAAARQAATESDGDHRLVWLRTASALTGSSSVHEARNVLTGMLDSAKLRAIALGCLDELTSPEMT
jgi:hypothetical protein